MLARRQFTTGRTNGFHLRHPWSFGRGPDLVRCRGDLSGGTKSIGAELSAFADAAGFEPKSGRYLLLPGKNGEALGGVLFGLEGPDESPDRFSPDGWRNICRMAPTVSPMNRTRRGSPRLRSRSGCIASPATAKPKRARSSSICRKASIATILRRIVDAVTLARDLINTPANDMGPAQLEQAARKLAARHAASINAVVGEELLERNFPLIHAVGRAATAAPRLIDMTDRLGRCQSSARDAGRQRRLLRHRGPRHQARHRHAQYEEGHGRRGNRAGAGVT